MTCLKSSPGKMGVFFWSMLFKSEHGVAHFVKEGKPMPVVGWFNVGDRVAFEIPGIEATKGTVRTLNPNGQATVHPDNSREGFSIMVSQASLHLVPDEETKGEKEDDPPLFTQSSSQRRQRRRQGGDEPFPSFVR